MRSPKRAALLLRFAGVIGCVLLLSGCVVVPYNPWHHPHYGYYWR